VSAPGQYILYPGPEDWEWRQGMPDGSVNPVAPPEPRPTSKHVSLALPCRWLFSLPVALDVPEGAGIEDLIVLNLERNSLPTQKNKWSYCELRKNGAQQLVHSFSLPDLRRQKKLPLPSEAASTAFPAWQLLGGHDSGLVLFRELGRWSLVFIENGKCAFFRDLALKEFKDSSVGVIRQAIVQMESVGLVSSAPPIDFLHLPPETFVERLTSAGFTVRSIAESPSGLRAPEKFLSVLPAPLEERLEEESRREQRKQFSGVALIFLFLAALGVAAFWFINHRETRQLREELAGLAPIADELQLTEAKWDSLALAIEPSLYPVETLHRVTTPLPEKEIRITRFEQSEREVILRGESQNPSRVFAWIKAMKNDPTCAHIEWLDPSIKMLPGNITQFVLQGTLRYAPDQ